MMHGTHLADAFLDAYRARSGAPVSDLWFFDLLGGLSALGSFRSWLPGYHDIGLTRLSEAILEQRLKTFLAQALCQAGRVGDRPDR